MTRILLVLSLLWVAAAVNASENRYIIEFSDDRGVASAAVEQAGAKVVLRLPRYNAVAAVLPDAALESLRNNPNILSIDEDPKRFPSAELVPYGIPMVQADQVLEGSGTSYGSLCIIDSGYYAGHADLPPNVTGSDVDGTGEWDVDGCGHGTHVAGTIAALGNNGIGVVGVNPSGTINLHIVKVLGDDCGWAYASDLVAALDVCVAAGSKVVNMSMGGGRSKTEERAFDRAYRDGVLSIASSGNDGNNQNSYPASYDSVISVAAVDSNSVHADFSQYNDQVELSAPGVEVLSTVPWDAHLDIGANTYQGNPVEYAMLTSGVTGTLADGGLCLAPGVWNGNVVLCERGEVAFYDKVWNVEAGGGVATVLYNNVPGSLWATLGEGYSSNIPAISLSQEDGQELLANYLGNSGTVVSLTEVSGYGAMSGTSMASAHVSGVAALLWSNFPDSTNEDIRCALDATALDLGDFGRDNEYGYGLIKAAAAYDHLADGADCAGPDPNPICTLLPKGASCIDDADCCSSKCRGKPGAKTCK